MNSTGLIAPNLMDESNYSSGVKYGLLACIRPCSQPLLIFIINMHTKFDFSTKRITFKRTNNKLLNVLYQSK